LFSRTWVAETKALLLRRGTQERLALGEIQPVRVAARLAVVGKLVRVREGARAVGAGVVRGVAAGAVGAGVVRGVAGRAGGDRQVPVKVARAREAAAPRVTAWIVRITESAWKRKAALAATVTRASNVPLLIRSRASTWTNAP
jgi:hypothetical protein